MNPHINAIEQMDAQKAMQRAKELDQDIAQGINRGPLHGIPFTAKDWLETKDYISSAGMPERKDYLPTEDATVIQRLQNAGAILIGKTNVPAGDFKDTNNALYRRTNNPYNLEYSPSGSSGGEASIVAAGGSAFGIGSDSGGSIRTPCHFCGVAGLRPTLGRIPATGHYPPIGGRLDTRSQIGPIARYIEDLKLLYPILCGNDGIDPYVIDMMHYSAPKPSSLSLAYYCDHPGIETDVDTRQAIETAATFLNGKVKSVLHAQPQCLGAVIDMTKVHWRCYGDSVPSGEEYRDLLNDWTNLDVAMKKYMQPFDAIILPVCPKSAQLHGQSDVSMLAFTLTYSLMNYPCSVVRIGTSAQGLPINAQIVAKSWNEEICLQLAQELEQLCGWKESTFDYLP